MSTPTEKAERDSGTDRTTYESVDALARELGIGRQAAYAGLRSGIIPSIRIGKRFVIPKAAIQEWLRTAGRPEVNA